MPERRYPGSLPPEAVMESIDELKTMRFKAFEFENRPEDATYHTQLTRYQAATQALNDQPSAEAKTEFGEAFLNLHRAFTAWKEEL
jgi:hypothetical protein